MGAIETSCGHKWRGEVAAFVSSCPFNSLIASVGRQYMGFGAIILEATERRIGLDLPESPI